MSVSSTSRDPGAKRPKMMSSSSRRITSACSSSRVSVEVSGKDACGFMGIDVGSLPEISTASPVLSIMMVFLEPNLQDLATPRSDIDNNCLDSFSAGARRQETKKMTDGLRKGLTSYGDAGFSLFLRKAFIKAMGYSDDALNRPIVGITNTYSDYNP